MHSWRTFFAICTFFVCIAKSTGQFYDAELSEEDSAKPTSLSDLCLSPGCIDAANKILKSMNPGADPCDDFSEFVCGNYEQTEPMADLDFFVQPPPRGKLEVDLRLQRIIKDIDEIKAPKAFADLKIAYEKCIEDEIGLSELKTEKSSEVDMSRLIGRAWQSLSEDAWTEDDFDQDFAMPYLFKFDKKTNGEIVSLELSIKRAPIHWSYLKEGESNEAVQIYSSFMKDIFIHLHVDDLLDESEIEQILTFEMELAKIVFPESESRDFTRQYSKTTIQELESNYPELHLKRLAKADDNSVVEMRMDSEIIGQLNEWISKKSKKGLANWVQWRYTVDRAGNMQCPFIARRTKMLLRTFYVEVEKGPKWRECVKYARSESPFLVDVLYYGQYLNKTLIDAAMEIYTGVKRQFIELVLQADWLNPSTKNLALNKVKKIKNDFAIYDEFMLDNKCHESYCDLKLSDGLLARNRLNVTKILTHLARATRSTEKNSSKWKFVDTSVDYIDQSLSLSVGAVSYTDGFEGIVEPMGLNYGALGYMLGHQLAHSLDDTNRLRDENGNFGEWWDSQSNETYTRRTQCLVEQYRDYGFVESGIPVKSITLLNAHIAENVGIRAAYLAHEKWRIQYRRVKLLPGLDYTPKQMFWISKVSRQCAHMYRPQSLRARMSRDERPLDKLPINIALSNMEEFSHDFQCGPRSKMNPVKKCSVW